MRTHAVRDATPDDARGIAIVHVDTWRDAYTGIVPDGFLAAMDYDVRGRRWREAISAPDGAIRVVSDGGRVVGWSSHGSARDVDVPGRVGELYGLYVSSAYWGTGVGAALMDDALHWMSARYRSATLWMLEANARARTFYERTGWSFDGTTKDDDRGTFVLKEVRARTAF